jgi:hypothetical protein
MDMDLKKNALKNLSKKLFDMEMGDYKGRKKKKKKDEPMAEVEIEVKKTMPMDKSKKSEPSDDFKSMVKDYFATKKSPEPARSVVLGSMKKAVDKPRKRRSRKKK